MTHFAGDLTVVIISVFANVAINLIIFAAYFGRHLGKVSAHESRLEDHKRKLEFLLASMATVTATCSVYFGRNPDSRASEEMNRVNAELRNMLQKSNQGE